VRLRRALTAMPNCPYTSSVCVFWEGYVRMSECSTVTRMNESYHTQGWVMSHIWMSHTTNMNIGWAILHVRMGLVAHINESRLTHKHRSRHGWQNAALHVLTVTCINASRLLIQMSYVARTNKPRYVHVYRGYVAHMNESCHTREYRSRHGCQNAALYLPTLVQIALCLLRTPRSSLPKQQQQKVL